MHRDGVGFERRRDPSDRGRCAGRRRIVLVAPCNRFDRNAVCIGLRCETCRHAHRVSALAQGGQQRAQIGFGAAFPRRPARRERESSRRLRRDVVKECEVARGAFVPTEVRRAIEPAQAQPFPQPGVAADAPQSQRPKRARRRAVRRTPSSPPISGSDPAREAMTGVPHAIASSIGMPERLVIGSPGQCERTAIECAQTLARTACRQVVTEISGMHDALGTNGALQPGDDEQRTRGRVIGPRSAIGVVQHCEILARLTDRIADEEQVAAIQGVITGAGANAGSTP